MLILETVLKVIFNTSYSPDVISSFSFYPVEIMVTCGTVNRPDVLIQSPSGQLKTRPSQKAVIAERPDDASHPVVRTSDPTTLSIFEYLLLPCA